MIERLLYLSITANILLIIVSLTLIYANYKNFKAYKYMGELLKSEMEMYKTIINAKNENEKKNDL